MAALTEATDKRVASHAAERHRDRRIAISLLLFSWLLFGAFEQNPFKLQGAVLEALVERGRLYFLHGNMKDIMFENLETNTPSFRFLFNIFPYEARYHVNHAPGQFLLAAPWYAALIKLGWRFETHERLVWRALVWSLTAPLGALGIMCVFFLARSWDIPWVSALLASLALALCGPWWPAFGVLYHDSIAVTLILIGVTIWQYRSASELSAIVGAIVSGCLLAFSMVTAYLVMPIVFLIVLAMLFSRPARRDVMLFGCGFLPTFSLLPIANMVSFGSPFATGYSAGGFEKNYPSPFDLSNAWEKVGFYLWDYQYGLLWMFPVFLVGAVGLLWSSPLKPSVRRLLIGLMTAHFLFIITMEHHGSVGWGMGRFFLPLYPILAFGLSAFSNLAVWKEHAARALLFSTMIYSAVFAIAGVRYGVQGVMEPGVPTLKFRFMLDYSAFLQGLIWVAIIAGVIAELLYSAFGSNPQSVQRSASHQSRQRISHGSKVQTVKNVRRRRRKN